LSLQLKREKNYSNEIDRGHCESCGQPNGQRFLSWLALQWLRAHVDIVQTMFVSHG